MDGRTDRRTDRISITKTVRRRASHGKNWVVLSWLCKSIIPMKNCWVKDMCHQPDVQPLWTQVLKTALQFIWSKLSRSLSGHFRHFLFGWDHDALWVTVKLCLFKFSYSLKYFGKTWEILSKIPRFFVNWASGMLRIDHCNPQSAKYLRISKVQHITHNY